MAQKRYIITATALSKQGKVLGTATNQYHKSHPLAKLYSIKAGLSDQRVYIHAELGAVLRSTNAILRAGDSKVHTTSVHTMLVQRFHNNGALANAKPCKSCQLMLKDFGVKKIVYTDEDGMKEYNV